MSVLPFTVTNSKLGQATIYSNTSSAIGHVLIIQYRNKRRRLKNFVLLLSHPVHVSKKIGCWVQSRFREVLDRCLPNKIPMWFNQRPHLKTLVLCHVWQIPDIDRPTFYCIKSFGDFCLSISIKIAVRNVQFFCVKYLDPLYLETTEETNLHYKLVTREETSEKKCQLREQSR